MTSEAATTHSPAQGAALEQELDAHRRELTAYCYRMLGSGFEAEDAVQETLVRAWKGYDRFEGRSALRSWLYRIATNVCLDMLRGPQRRARAMEMGPSVTADVSFLPGVLPESAFVQPVADARVIPAEGDPAEIAAARDSVRLAFVAALQYLPPQQRAVLILREVLRWPAKEVAELLDTSVAAVNSALQRARATLADAPVHDADPTPADPDQAALLARYVAAFEAYDMEALVALLHHDVLFSMPPFPMWLQGPDQVEGWLLGQGSGCQHSRLVPIAVNGGPAFASYRQTRPGLHEPFAIQLLVVSGDRITGIHNYLGPELFESFGLPLRLES